ncbi:MAG: hypothetical protein N2260_08365 [Syntrophobacterales bacterium]|nr:hypothetical protein [Syntrophobacterales bacterium]
MIIAIGIALIVSGYTLLYTISEESSFERTVNQVFMGITLNLIGAILVAFQLLRRSR